MEERLMDNLMNSFESSNQHTDVLTEEKETVQKTELLPKENKAQQPCVFNFNKCFVSVGFVANAGGDLAQMSSQMKMKEENSIEESNPCNKNVKLLERVLDSHDSIMKEGKDDREEASIGDTTRVSIAKKAKAGTRAKEEENQQLQRESN